MNIREMSIDSEAANPEEESKKSRPLINVN